MYEKRELVAVASEMNTVMGLAPKIRTNATAMNIEKQIKENMNGEEGVYSTDPFSKKTWKILKELGCKAAQEIDTEDEPDPTPEYRGVDDEVFYKDGTPKQSETGRPLYAGYNRRHLNEMRLFMLIRLANERFDANFDQDADKKEVINHILTHDYVPRKRNEPVVNYLAPAKEKAFEHKVPKIVRSRNRYDCIVEALRLDTDDIHEIVDKAEELYVMAGGKQNKTQMIHGMRIVLNTLIEADEEAINKAKRIYDDFSFTIAKWNK